MAALSLRKELANRLCGALAPSGLPIWIPEQPRRFFMPAIERTSCGVAAVSHNHQREIPLINSTEPMKGRITFSAAGCSFKHSFFSSSERMRLPASTGLLP